MFEKDLLKGRTILITGGGTGLGRSMALRFAELGATLFLVGRREEPLRETVAEIRGMQAGLAEEAEELGEEQKQIPRRHSCEERETGLGMTDEGRAEESEERGEAGKSVKGGKRQKQIPASAAGKPRRHSRTNRETGLPSDSLRASPSKLRVNGMTVPSTRRSLRNDTQGKQGKPFEAQGKATYACADVRDFAAVEAAIATAESEFGVPFGGIDTLVNNAAGNFLARTEKLSPNAFNAVVGIVLTGTFHCTLALGRRWIAARQPGNILNITTTYAAANSGSGFVVPSACAKAGVLAMTRSLAVEWARHRIRLNAIAPGPFPTEGAWSRLMPSRDFEERARERHPMKRFGRHDELANLAAYLISPQAEYVNGECVVIDGGQWLRGAGEFNDAAEFPDAMWEEFEKKRK